MALNITRPLQERKSDTLDTMVEPYHVPVPPLALYYSEALSFGKQGRSQGLRLWGTRLPLLRLLILCDFLDLSVLHFPVRRANDRPGWPEP